MNIWNFTGNLGRDSEVKYLPSGDAICTFSVGVSSGYGDKKKTTWANCALFGKQAAGTLPSFLTVGTSVAVSGEVTLEEWAAQDGTKKSTLKVNVLKVDLIGSSQGKNAPQAQAAQAYQQNNAAIQRPQQAPQQPAGFNDWDDSEQIPFQVTYDASM